MLGAGEGVMGGKGVRNEKKVCMVQVLFVSNYRSGPSRNHTIYGTVIDISLLVPVQHSPLIDKKTEIHLFPPCLPD